MGEGSGSWIDVRRGARASDRLVVAAALVLVFGVCLMGRPRVAHAGLDAARVAAVVVTRIACGPWTIVGPTGSIIVGSFTCTWTLPAN